MKNNFEPDDEEDEQPEAYIEPPEQDTEPNDRPKLGLDALGLDKLELGAIEEEEAEAQPIVNKQPDKLFFCCKVCKSLRTELMFYSLTEKILWLRCLSCGEIDFLDRNFLERMGKAKTKNHKIKQGTPNYV